MSFCHRHPKKKARRTCYRCHRIICLDCYYRREHHIFCSRVCHVRFFIEDRRRRLSAVLERRVASPLVLTTLLILLAPVTVVILQATGELESGSFFSDHRRMVKNDLRASIMSIEEGDRIMTIRGEATPDALVILLRNGSALANVHSSGLGRFTFELDLDSSASSFAVTAVASSTLATTLFTPSVPFDLKKLPDRSIRSGSRRFVESFTRGPIERPEIVLSLDAGSSDQGALDILTTLRRYRIRTTIFLTGEFIRRYPGVVREIVADGHEIGNHTFSHPRLTTFATNRRQLTLSSLSKEAFQSELRRTADAFRDVTGGEMSKFWRAPFGEENSEIRGWAAELGYLHVGWTRGRRYNLDSLDWVVDQRSPIYHPPERLARRLLDFDTANGTTLNGGIILMHLGSDRREDQSLARALPIMIEELRERGFRFVKVSRLREARTEVADATLAQVTPPTAPSVEE